MAITMVSYQKTYNVGPYVSERIGMEASLDEGQDPKFVLSELKKLADEVNQVNNPHLFNGSLPEIKIDPVLGVDYGFVPLDGTITTGGDLPNEMTLHVKVPVEPQLPKKQADMIASINGGTSEKEVKLYEKLAAKYPAVLEAYNQKLKEFQQ